MLDSVDDDGPDHGAGASDDNGSIGNSFFDGRS